MERVRDPLGHDTTYTYDGAGNVSTVTNPEGEITKTVYDDAGQLVSQAGPADSEAGLAATTTTFTYDLAGRPETTTDPEGSVTKNVYDPVGRLERVIGPTGDVTDPAAPATVYTYNALGEIKTLTGPEGGVTSFTYGPLGRKATEIDPNGNTTKFRYDDDGNLTEVEDPFGKITLTDYDVAGRPVKVTDRDGKVTETTYDGAGRVKTVKAPGDPAGELTTFHYDGDGRRWKVTAPDGVETSTVFSPGGLATETVDAEGRQTTVSFDDAGRPKTVTAPDGLQTTTDYDTAGRPVKVTDPTGGETITTYDGYGRPVSVTDPYGVVTATGYDNNGRVRTTQRTGEGQVHYDYDVEGNMDSVTDPLGDVTTLTFDKAGRRTSRTGPALSAGTSGVSESWEYWPGGELKGHTMGWGTERTYTYDANNRTETVTDPEDGVTTMGYSDEGRLLSKQVTGQAAESYEYNDAGDRTKVTNADGEWVYGYDLQGNRTFESGPNGRTQSYGYDKTGLMVSHTNADGVTRTIGHDQAGRTESITADAWVADGFNVPDGWNLDPTRWNNGTSGGAQLSTLWGAAFMNLPAGSSARISPFTPATADVDMSAAYLINAKNLDLRVREGWGNGFLAVRASATPGQAELVQNNGWGSTVLESFAVPAQGRIRLRAEGSNVKVRTWGYDDPEPETWTVDTTSTKTSAGWVSINASTDANTSGGVLVDDLKIAPVGDPVSLADWEYDTEGRLDTATVGSGTRTWSWDHYRPESQTLTAFGGAQTITRTWDNTGRLKTTNDSLDGATTYTYDQASQLATVDGPGARDWTYTYNPGGHRATADGPAGQTTYHWDTTTGLLDYTNQTGTTTPYEWDDAGRLTEQGTGTDQTDYTWDTNSRLTSIAGPENTLERTFNPDGLETGLTTTPDGQNATPVAGITDWTTGPVPQPGTTTIQNTGQAERIDGPDGLAGYRTGNSGVLPVPKDPMGSPVLLGAPLAANVSYDPFGAPAGTTNTTSPAAFGYRGERTLNPGGDQPLIDLRNRAYDPTLGIFLTPDPLDGIQGTTTLTNPHHYTNNSPTNLTDPLGLQPDDCALDNDLGAGASEANHGCDQVPDVTLGICAQWDAVIGLGPTVSGCFVADSYGNFGLAGSLGGRGGFEASIGIAGLISGAPTIEKIRGVSLCTSVNLPLSWAIGEPIPVGAGFGVCAPIPLDSGYPSGTVVFGAGLGVSVGFDYMGLIPLTDVSGSLGLVVGAIKRSSQFSEGCRLLRPRLGTDKKPSDAFRGLGCQ